MGNEKIPSIYKTWMYDKRAKSVKDMYEGKDMDMNEMFLNFTMHCPTFISNGSDGLNGSIKGIGFIPKEEHAEKFLSEYLNHIDSDFDKEYSKRGLEILINYMYGDGCEDNLDFTKLSSLELAKKHSWKNFKENDEITLCFYRPPRISFEVRGRVEIHEDGLWHKLVNAQHDVYHKPNKDKWNDRPAYIIKVEEIYDNSATKEGFGTKIYPK